MRPSPNYLGYLLPDSVVDADTLNIFKSRLDKHWLDQDVLYNFHSQLTGTGCALICMLCCKRYGQRGIPAPVYSHWIWICFINGQNLFSVDIINGRKLLVKFVG